MLPSSLLLALLLDNSISVSFQVRTSASLDPARRESKQTQGELRSTTYLVIFISHLFQSIDHSVSQQSFFFSRLLEPRSSMLKLILTFPYLLSTLLSFPGSNNNKTSSSNTRRKAPNQCSICLAPYQAHDAVTWSSNADCSHVFHHECIYSALDCIPERFC